jgi:hypothetical protein
MIRLLLATVLAAAAIVSSSAGALEVGEFVKLLPFTSVNDRPVGCTLFEDARVVVLSAARYGRQHKWQIVDEVNNLHEKSRICDAMFTAIDLPGLEYRVVDKNNTTSGNQFAYFCLAAPHLDSCMWVHLPERALNR